MTKGTHGSLYTNSALLPELKYDQVISIQFDDFTSVDNYSHNRTKWSASVYQGDIKEYCAPITVDKTNDCTDDTFCMPGDPDPETECIHFASTVFRYIWI